MRVLLNGEPQELPTPCTVADLLRRLQLEATSIGLAVAVNRQVIPRSAWEATLLKEGDQVELVYARQGG